jgi:hypothetical protein
MFFARVTFQSCWRHGRDGHRSGHVRGYGPKTWRLLLEDLRSPAGLLAGTHPGLVMVGGSCKLSRIVF